MPIKMKFAIYQFLQDLPSKLQEEDKIKHMVWSFWLTVTALVLWSSLTAFLAIFSIGFAKECWDARYGSGFCFFDMAGNMVGIVAGFLSVFVFLQVFTPL